MAKLFAFKIANPVTAERADASVSYDPQLQRQVWHGGDAPLAVFCTGGNFKRCQILIIDNLVTCKNDWVGLKKCDW
jgi:hypothetical protein